MSHDKQSNSRATSSAVDASNPEIKDALREWMRPQQINSFGRRNDDLALEHEQLAVLYKLGVKDKYQLEHCYLLGGTEDMRVVLGGIKEDLSADGAEAFIAVRPYIHMTNVYIRNVDGKLHAIIVDPQGWEQGHEPNVNIAAALQEAFPDCVIHSSSSQLQLQSDSRNCSMFGYKLIPQFAKHGEAIMNDLIAEGGAQQEWNGIPVFSHDTSGLFRVSEKSSGRATNIANVIGNPDMATAKRHQLRDEKLPEFVERVSLVDSSGKVKPAIIADIIDEMSGKKLLASRKESMFDIDIQQNFSASSSSRSSASTVAISYTPTPNTIWEHNNFPRYMHTGIFPNHVGDDTTRILMDGFEFTNRGQNFQFKASLGDDGKVTYSVIGADIADVQAGLLAYKNSAEYLLASSPQNNMRQTLALDAFLQDINIATELHNVKGLGEKEGGLFFTDTVGALQASFAKNDAVHVVSSESNQGIYSEQALTLPINLEAAMTSYADKRFFVFPYSIGDEHNIGVVVDRELQQIRIYDHQDDTRESESLSDSVLKGLAAELGFAVVDGYGQSPYTEQGDDWECGIFSVLSIENDVLRHQQGMGIPAEKTMPDLDKEAGRILLTASSGSVKERALNKITDLWKQNFPDAVLQPWMMERFKNLQPSAAEDIAGINTYVRAMHVEARIDAKNRVDLLGVIENSGCESLQELQGYLNDSGTFNYCKELLPTASDEMKRGWLNDFATAHFFEKKHEIPQEVRDAERQQHEKLLQLKEEQLKKRADKYAEAFPVLFEGADDKQKSDIVSKYGQYLERILQKPSKILEKKMAKRNADLFGAFLDKAQYNDGILNQYQDEEKLDAYFGKIELMSVDELEARKEENISDLRALFDSAEFDTETTDSLISKYTTHYDDYCERLKAPLDKRSQKALNRKISKATEKLMKELIEYAIKNDDVSAVFSISGHRSAGDFKIATLEIILNYAAKKGSVNLFKELFKDERIEVDVIADQLNAACDKGRLEIIKLILADERTDPAYDSNKLLGRALNNGNLQVAGLLMTDRRVIDAIQGNDDLVHYALQHGDIDLVKFLLEKGAIPKFAAIKACDTNNHELLRLVLDWKNENGEGIDPNEKSVSAVFNGDRRGNKAIEVACAKGDPVIIKMLLDDPRIRMLGLTQNLFELVITSGNVDSVNSLKLLFEWENKNNNLGFNADLCFFKALKVGNVDVLEFLLDSGIVREDAFRASEYVIIDHAMSSSVNISGLELLFDRGLLRIDSVDEMGRTLFDRAVSSGNVKIIEFCIRKGFDVDKVNKGGATPISIACYNGDAKIVNLLIKSGADIDKPNKSGERPIHVACSYGNLDVLKLFLEKGADISVDKDGCTLLHHACLSMRSDKSVLRYLIDSGYDIDAVDHSGKKPESYCGSPGTRDFMRDLMWERKNTGTTSLMAACKANNAAVVKTLLEQGADPNLPDKSGKTALGFACDSNALESVALLLVSPRIKVSQDDINLAKTPEIRTMIEESFAKASSWAGRIESSRNTPKERQ